MSLFRAATAVAFPVPVATAAARRPFPAAPELATRPPAESLRCIGVDAGRIIAALATTWLHTVSSEELAISKELCRFGTCFFCAVAAAFLVFSLRRRHDQPYGPYVRRRFHRLYLAFLVWSAIYLVARLAKHLVLGSNQPIELRWGDLLLAGPAQQTWFLPFLFLITLICFPLVRWAVVSEARRKLVGILTLTLGGAILVTPQSDLSAIFPSLDPWLASQGLDYFFERVWARSPAFLLGLSGALLLPDAAARAALAPVGSPNRKALALAALAFAAFCAFLSAAFFSSDPSLAELRRLSNTTAGLALVVFALGGWNASGLARLNLSALAPIAFGIFLAHALIIETAQSLLARAGVPNVWQTDVAVFIAAVLGSAALTLLIQSSRRTRWLIPT